MRSNWRYPIVLAVLFSLVFPGTAPAAPAVDNSIWAGLLKSHVKKGRVNYDGFKGDEATLDRYLALLSSVNPKTLSRNHQFAFYINAYNAFTVKLILTEYPGINSIKEIGSFFSGPWSKKFIHLGGHKVSLDYIEHEVLRPRFKDPRVHFAVNCASKGCPPLRNEPYEGKQLETQLDEQAREFINTSRRTFFKDNTLFTTRIFKWFGEDFGDNPLAFVRQYARAKLKQDLDNATGDIRIAYLPYDWTLNR